VVETNDREYWVGASPDPDRAPCSAVSPVERKAQGGDAGRGAPMVTPGGSGGSFTYLEAMGRFAYRHGGRGSNPAQQSGPEGRPAGNQYAEWSALWLSRRVRQSRIAGLHEFQHRGQPAGGRYCVSSPWLFLRRAPTELWAETRRQDTTAWFIAALQSFRASIQPSYSNWLLFSAMVESGNCRSWGVWWDPNCVWTMPSATLDTWLQRRREVYG